MINTKVMPPSEKLVRDMEEIIGKKNHKILISPQKNLVAEGGWRV